jgi:hypothetical protein
LAGLAQSDFEQMKQQLEKDWNAATTRDDGLKVIVSYGQRYGYKNVMAALQGRLPKRYTSGTSLDTWIEEQRAAESKT